MIGGRTHLVVVDSSVWASRTLRDWFVLLHQEGPGLFDVKWSEDLRAETVRAVRRRNPDVDGAVITRVADMFTEQFPQGRLADFTTDVPRPADEGDLHVRALAEACQADMLVTGNVQDLRPATEEESDALYHEVYTPDEFLVLVDDSAPHVVRRATERNCAYWIDRARQRGEQIDVNLPEWLEKAGVPAFAQRVRSHQLAI